MITKNIEPIGDVSFHKPLDEAAFKFQHEKFSELIPKDSIVLDIGAHVGSFSIAFGSCVGENGKVLAFEPNPITFGVLKQHAEANPKFNIEPYNLACTHEDGNFKFHYSDSNIYGAGTNGGYFNGIENGDKIKRFHSEEIDVIGVNVCDFVNKMGQDVVDKIKFIKSDTEGFDKEVLKTLRPIIEKNRPVLMVEAFQGSTEDEIKDFYNTLKSFEYEIYDVSPLDNKTDCTGPLTEGEISHYVYNVMQNGNFFCFHKDELHKYNLPTTISGKTAVVVFGRNDGYKEQERFIIHINTMLETFDEVVYIDWNSPTHSFLYDVMDKIHHTGRLKHIVIPPEYANMMTMNDEKAQVCTTVLIQNIGIRRTDAEWIVLSTTDVIPPKKEVLNEFINKANKNNFYTFSRRDIEYNDVLDNLDTLDEYRKHLDETTEPRYFPTKVTPNDNYSIFNCCGDFQLATKNLWYKIRGFEEMMMYSCFPDTNAQKKAVLYGFGLVPVYDIPLYHMSHKGMENDGSSPSKQFYNDPYDWVENFNKYLDPLNSHIGGLYMISRNADTWGFSNIEIESEVI
jgi:FkbM family methyltransferase